MVSYSLLLHFFLYYKTKDHESQKMPSSAGLPLEEALARAVEGTVSTVLNSTNSLSLPS